MQPPIQTRGEAGRSRGTAVNQASPTAAAHRTPEGDGDGDGDGDWWDVFLHPETVPACLLARKTARPAPACSSAVLATCTPTCDPGTSCPPPARAWLPHPFLQWRSEFFGSTPPSDAGNLRRLKLRSQLWRRLTLADVNCVKGAKCRLQRCNSGRLLRVLRRHQEDLQRRFRGVRGGELVPGLLGEHAYSGAVSSTCHASALHHSRSPSSVSSGRCTRGRSARRASSIFCWSTSQALPFLSSYSNS